MNGTFLFLNIQNTTRAGITFLLGLFMLIALSTVAIAQQFPSDLWHEGKIVLLEGDTLKGSIKYDLQQDLLQYSIADQRTTAYSARKVLFFEIYDATVRKYRQFYALPFTTITSPNCFMAFTSVKIPLEVIPSSLETRIRGFID